MTAPSPVLTADQLLPCVIELRNVCDAAGARYGALRQAQVDWVQADNRGNVAELIEAQTRLFDSVESFLGLWARASLILFPGDAGSSAAQLFRRARGAALRQRLTIPDDDLLGDRDLRDAWMHFDERADALVNAGKLTSLQKFTRSARVIPGEASGIPRLVEVDALRVHYHTRDGAVAIAQLAALNSRLTYVGLAANTA